MELRSHVWRKHCVDGKTMVERRSFLKLQRRLAVLLFAFSRPFLLLYRYFIFSVSSRVTVAAVLAVPCNHQFQTRERKRKKVWPSAYLNKQYALRNGRREKENRQRKPSSFPTYVQPFFSKQPSNEMHAASRIGQW